MQESSLGFLVLQASDPFFLKGKEDIVKDFADHIAVALWNQGLRDELIIQSENLIEERLNQRDRYAAICHELNKRLALIVGCHETLKKRLPGDEDLKNAGQVVKEMNQQVKKIFNLTGNLREETSIPVNFNKLLDEVIKEMELLQKYQNRDITIIRKGAKVGNIIADRELLYEALSNLASNAVKFNKPGGTTTFSVNIVSGETCSFVECNVADTGKGLTDTEIETLFRIPRKYKASNRDQGIGIGLYIARQAARELGGDITLVETEVGKGTTFRFSFPVWPANSI
jgi:signal transduction histidine kinase